MTFEDIQMPHERLCEGHNSGLSGKDKNCESSQTDVQERAEDDTEELAPKRGFVSVVWKLLGFKKKKKADVDQTTM